MNNRQTIKKLCSDTLSIGCGSNEIVDLNYEQRFIYSELVRYLEITEESFDYKISKICNELFDSLMEDKIQYYVNSLLGFSIELDKYCTIRCPWYERKKLIELLTNILVKVGYIPPSANKKYNCILL